MRDIEGGDRWTVPTPGDDAPRVAAVLRRWRYLREAAGGDLFTGGRDFLPRGAVAYVVAEIAYGCALPDWVKVRGGDNAWELAIRPEDPADAWVLHVGHRADGTSRVYGCMQAGLGKRIGEWRADWRHPAWTLPTSAPEDAPPHERARCQFPPYVLLRQLGREPA